MRGFGDSVCWEFSKVLFVFRVRNRVGTLFELPQKSKFRPRGRLCIIGDQTPMIGKATPERLSFFSDAIFGMSPNFFDDEGTLWAIYSVLCLDLPQNRLL